jgi:DNA-directed RNA polymerase subunit omega
MPRQAKRAGAKRISQGERMLDDLKEEAIVNKVGGRFKLSTLIQKRMVALNTGARALVDLKTTDKMAVVIQEILQDKIFLDQSGNLVMRGSSAGDAVRRAMLTDISDVGGADD